MEDRANKLNIRIHRFFEQSDPVNDMNGKFTGKNVVRDYVEYGPPGLMDKQSVVARIDRLMKVEDPGMDNSNPAVRMAFDRWQFIKPHYEAWKKGEELPEGGTPLAALNFLHADQVAVLKRNGIKTAEDLAFLSDTNIGSVKLPRMQDLRLQAKRFLEAQDTNVTAAKTLALEEELAAMRQQMAEFMASQKAAVEADPEVDENGDRLPKKRKTLVMPHQAA